MKTSLTVSSTLAVLLKTALATDTCVHLGYSSYNGAALPNGVTQWLGIRYAAPPLGDLRFAAPQDPPTVEGIVEADKHGPICLATLSNGEFAPLSSPTRNEDCLFMDIYAPSNATETSKLPVMFFIQGGGFNTNSNANFNGSGLVLASEMNMIVVTSNYRVGPYGFLASQEVLEGGSINNGLKDQRKAMEWVQQHIEQFGGNPGHVVLSGDSAGAASINLQLTAYGGRDDHLFHATAAESQSFATINTVPESQFMYDNLAIRAGCASCNDTLACLRALTADQLQTVNFNTPFPGAQNPPLYMYGPTLDNDFIKEYTYPAYANGNFVQLPAIYGDAQNEGTVFTPNGTANISDADTFIKDQFPYITLSQLREWNALYPVEDYPQFPDSGRFWRQAATGYGEMRYNCPGLFINAVYARLGVPAWNYLWDVKDPPAEASGLGVTHTVEINAIWGPTYLNGAPKSYLPGGVNAGVVPVVQGYWTSFIRAMDPNTFRRQGTPKWEAWTSENEYRQLRFRTNGTAMKAVPRKQRERCDYLSSIGEALRQ
jgi:carboxylesterase type B